MEDKKFLKLVIKGLFCLALIKGFLFFYQAQSYDKDCAHPKLTENMAQLYNQYVEPDLTQQQIEWLKWGSQHEDTPPRYVNHFYDPINNKGWTNQLTAKQWAQDSVAQSVPGLDNDYSWSKAIYEYQQGNDEYAYQALGHILHLIEDMTVPAHTRNDTHLTVKGTESPYENWVATYCQNHNFDFNGQIVIYDNLGAYFDNLANYSNKYYYSADSIGKYETPIITREDENYLYGIDEYGNEFKLLRKLQRASRRNFTELSFYKLNDEVTSDYFQRLGPKAVQYGAGVIYLFHQEMSKKQIEEPASFWSVIKNFANKLWRQTQPQIQTSFVQLIEPEDTLQPEPVGAIHELSLQPQPTSTIAPEQEKDVEAEHVLPRKDVGAGLAPAQEGVGAEDFLPQKPKPLFAEEVKPISEIEPSSEFEKIEKIEIVETSSPPSFIPGGAAPFEEEEQEPEPEPQPEPEPEPDITPPSRPILSSHTLYNDSTTIYVNQAQFTLSGFKDSDAIEVFLYNASTTESLVNASTTELTWQAFLDLGFKYEYDDWCYCVDAYYYFPDLAIKARDEAGNESDTLELIVYYDFLEPLGGIGPPTQIYNATSTITTYFMWQGLDWQEEGIFASGFDRLEIEQQIDDNPWQFWQDIRGLEDNEMMDIYYKYLSFQAEPGHIYNFRGRTYDLAGNVNDWTMAKIIVQ